MSFTITKNSKFVTNKGGGSIKIWEVESNGSIVMPMVVTDLGFIEDSAIADETEVTPIADETLETVVTLEGQQTVKISGNLLQSGVDMFELVNETKGKYYGCYKQLESANGKYEEVFFGLGQVKPSITQSSPNPRTNLEINFSVMPQTVNYDSTACTLIGAHATSTSISSGTYYKGVKTTIV